MGIRLLATSPGMPTSHTVPGSVSTIFQRMEPPPHNINLGDHCCLICNYRQACILVTALLAGHPGDGVEGLGGEG